MAFKPDRPLCFSSMGHLNPDTLKFAVLLRDGPPPDDTDDWKKGLSEEEVKILEEENKAKQKERKIKPCTVKKCKEEEHATQMCMLERVQLLKKLDDVKEQYTILDEDIHQMEEASVTIEAETHQLEQLLAELRAKEKKEVKERVVEATRLKQTLELAIHKAKLEIARIQDEEKANKDAAERETRAQESARGGGGGPLLEDESISPLNFSLPVKKHPTKHTGKYDFVATGFKQWSCCMGDEYSQDGCADDHSVGIKSTLIHKGNAAHQPYQVRQKELAAVEEEKKEKLHHPVLCPPRMNKGFRDVRQSHSNYSFFSRNHAASALEIAHHAGIGGHNQASNTKRPGTTGGVLTKGSQITHSPIRGDASVGGASRGSKGSLKGFDTTGSKIAGSMEIEEYGTHDNAKTSLVFLEASMAHTNSILEAKRTAQPQSNKPSSYSGFPMMGSMRVGQKKLISGSFPEFAHYDLALEYNPAKDPGMVRSDVANSKITPDSQVLDSASLLASYNHSKGGMTGVGQQRRHLGLAEMKRRGGRPLTSQSGPHLRTTSTVGRATSFSHFCQKQC